MPQSASGGAVGLAATSGSASRYLGYWVAAFLVITAFCSKLIILWLVVPGPVISALLLYLAAFLLMAGLKLVASRMLDDRRRSEERRVGKEGVSPGRSRWSPYHLNKKYMTEVSRGHSKR